ncbi:MAG: tetraacyldisaccharide 4'-kinase [Povalibacter sp.]
MLSDQALQRLWYQGKPRWLFVSLMPLSCLFLLVVKARRAFYKIGWFKAHKVPAAVIVVGNVTVGGTGKTPFVMWLAELMQQRGRRVGIVLRGYGGTSTQWPRQVTSQTSALDVGDEAVLHARRTGAIVVAGPDRVAAAELAIRLGAELIISDDGLQHYRLARDAEICVLDHRRGLGTRWVLPAGPLREPSSRMRSVDLIVSTVRGNDGATCKLDSDVLASAHIDEAISLISGERRPLKAFIDGKVHAIAAIGHPEAFFAGLRQAGLELDMRAFADHAALTAVDIQFADQLPVLMTEKDAVKCLSFADERHWYVPLQLHVEPQDAAKVSALIDEVLRFRLGSR